MLFFQLNDFQSAAAGLNASLTWMDYKFIHAPRKGCLGLSIGCPLSEIRGKLTHLYRKTAHLALITLNISQRNANNKNARHPFLGTCMHL